MHILFICNELPPSPHGGIGIFVKLMSSHLLERGVQVSIAGFDETISEDRVSDEDGVSVHRLHDPYTHAKKVLLLGRYYLDVGFYRKRRHLSTYVNALLKDSSIDIVESYDWSGPLWNKPPAPLIVRMHGAYVASQLQEKKRPSKLVYYLEKRNIKMATEIIAVSDHIARTTNTALGTNRKYTVIHNPVDTDTFIITDVARNPDKIVFVGRLHERKGLFELFASLEKIMAEDTDCYLELYGGGGDKNEEEIRQAVPDHLKDRIIFKGYVPHSKLPEIYSSAGMVVCPSRAEAFGLSAVEAMSCGAPVMMTRETSGPEIIKEGINGVLTSLYSQETLTNDLRRMIRSVRGQEFDAQQIRQYAIDHFSMKKIVENNIAFYESCLSKSH